MAFQAANGQAPAPANSAPTVQAAPAVDPQKYGATLAKIAQIIGSGNRPDGEVDLVNHETLSVDSKLFGRYQKETGSRDQVVNPSDKTVQVKGQQAAFQFGQWYVKTVEDENAKKVEPFDPSLDKSKAKKPEAFGSPQMDKAQSDALVGNLKKLETEGKYAGQINVLENDHLQVAPNLYNQYRRETTPTGQTPMQFNTKNPIDVRGEDSIKAFGDWMQKTVEREKQKGASPRAESMEQDGPHFSSPHNTKTVLALNSSNVQASPSSGATPNLPPISK